MVVVDGVMEFGVLDVAAAAVVEPIAFFFTNNHPNIGDALNCSVLTRHQQ